MLVEATPSKLGWILPERKDFLPAITASFIASAISKGFFAFAIAVFIKTPSHPNSIASAASDACIAMEIGCDGVLINTAIAKAKNPYLMAEAMKKAVIAGRDSFLSGRIKKNYLGNASSPKSGQI